MAAIARQIATDELADRTAALDARTLGLRLVVAGHYETEAVVLDPLMKRLQNECFDVQYKLSRMDGSPFVRL